MDAGVFVEKTATGTIVEANRIEGNLYGICLHGAENAIARGTRSSASQRDASMRPATASRFGTRRGQGVENNDIRFGRDGIFVIASKRNVFNGNRFRDLRFAIHYMYTDDSEVSCNISIGNTVGFAIMFSHRLTVREMFLMATGITDCFSISPMAPRSRQRGQGPAAVGGALGGGRDARQGCTRARAALVGAAGR